MFVELLARHAGLDPAVEVVGVDLQDLVHLGDVDGDAAGERSDMPFERRAGAEGDDRDLVPGADLHDLCDFLAGAREGDRVRRLALVVGEVLPMLLAHGIGRGEPVAQKGAEVLKRGGGVTMVERW